MDSQANGKLHLRFYFNCSDVGKDSATALRETIGEQGHKTSAADDSYTVTVRDCPEVEAIKLVEMAHELTMKGVITSLTEVKMTSLDDPKILDASLKSGIDLFPKI
jgi:hypothetical protein